MGRIERKYVSTAEAAAEAARLIGAGTDFMCTIGADAVLFTIYHHGEDPDAAVTPLSGIGGDFRVNDLVYFVDESPQDLYRVAGLSDQVKWPGCVELSRVSPSAEGVLADRGHWKRLVTGVKPQ